MKVRVLHPITRLIVGGAQENTMYTAAMLDPSRYQTEIISGPQTGPEGSLIEAVQSLGVHLEILPQLVREISPIRDWFAFWKLYAHMKAGGYQIVHTHSTKAGLLGRVAAWMAGVPIIIHTVHGWSYHDKMSSIRRSLYAWVEKFPARIVDRLIVVAKQDIDKGLKYHIGTADQYLLIRSSIPLDDFNPKNCERQSARKSLGIPLDVRVLGNVGRFSPQKNPLDWVRVAAKVAERIPECWFLLVGDGPLRAEVDALISELGLTHRFILTGLRRDVPQLMSAMDVFLLTSLWEGLPRVIPEAMSMQIPVIANRADGTVEAIQHGETGFLCDPGDLDQMADYCVDLLTDPEMVLRMGEKGRAFALKEFDINVMIAQIDGLYQSLMEKKGIQI